MAVQQTTLDSHALVKIVVRDTNYREETMHAIRTILLQDQQCQWCGGHEVIYCKPCDHSECGNCGAGGYCQCMQCGCSSWCEGHEDTANE